MKNSKKGFACLLTVCAVSLSTILRCSFSSKIQIQDGQQQLPQNLPPRKIDGALAVDSQIPELPVYIGSGYNIYTGNPKSENGLDPGFYNNVFDYSYSKNKTTDDYKFKIPDQISSRKMSTCSFSTEVSTFLGTHAYQSDLKTIVDFEGNNSFNEFAFSMSGNYNKIQNLTSVEKTSLTHASAQCECYELLQDKFTAPKLKQNFIEGAVECYKKNNWGPFINEFGTHYVHEVVMGGRATQEISYTYTNFAIMQSVNADLNITAKASFAKAMGDTSFDWSKYAKDVGYSESVSTIRRFMYIGGEPTKNGTIEEWQEKIISDPMPIRYKIYNLGSLFTKISARGFDVGKAQGHFMAAIEAYCVGKKCQKPTEDFPKPPPATIDIQNSTMYGTQAGQKYQSFYKSTTLSLKRVLVVCTGTEVRGIQLMLTDGVTSLYTAQEGLPGTPVTWDVPDGQFVNQIEVRHTDIITSLTFITDKGVKSQKFGGDGGTYSLITVPQGYRVVGFFGEKGGWIQKIAFVFAKTIYPNPSQPFEQTLIKEVEF